MIVIGLGQDSAGDDAVGLVVVREIARCISTESSVKTVLLHDAAELIAHLATPSPVVIVDAVVTVGKAGRVIQLNPSDLSDSSPPVSSHAMSVQQAIELAYVLHADAISPSIRIVGITIDRPDVLSTSLSQRVRDAVPVAVTLVVELALG